MLATCTQMMTSRASAHVVLASAVGAGRWCCVGISSIQLQNRMNRNSATPSGTVYGATDTPISCSTCPWIAPTRVSQNSWIRPGTALLVTCDRRKKPSRMTTMPTITVEMIVSTLKVSPRNSTVVCVPTSISASGTPVTAAAP